MLIRLSEIEDVIVLKGEMNITQFPKTDDVNFRLTAPVSYELTVSKFDDAVVIEGPVRVHASVACSRCLEDLDLAFSVDMSIKLMPKAALPESPEMELHNEDLDVYYYEGDEIDIDPFIYEEVLLDMPMRPLCDEACKGICPTCGKNKNTESCECPEAGLSLLGEKLKSFLD
ncbi:MAG: YceD family protein [Syntrophorhabdaceae bacterium]